MAEVITVSLSTLSMVLQFIALLASILGSYYSYKIYKYNRLSKAWLMITLTVHLLLLRRIFGITDLIFNIETLPEILQFLDRPLIPAITSILLATGLWIMKNNWDNLELERKKLQEDWVCFYKGKIKNAKSVKK